MLLTRGSTAIKVVKDNDRCQAAYNLEEIDHDNSKPMLNSPHSTRGVCAMWKNDMTVVPVEWSWITTGMGVSGVPANIG